MMSFLLACYRTRGAMQRGVLVEAHAVVRLLVLDIEEPLVPATRTRATTPLIFDIVGATTFDRCQPSLKPKVSFFNASWV
jgi:hypothetical protein